MRTHAQAVVIGGGVIGCSILYHLTKLGWTDVVLLERSELTSGSTWHAAANIHGLHDNNNITRIQNYTMDLYNALEAETGQSCGVFQPGSLYLAQTEAREHQLRLQAAKAKYYGLPFREIDRAEAEALHPLVDFDGIRCIMYEENGGNVDPSGVTNAYAVGARQNGAEIIRFCPVTGTEQQPDGSWIVRTQKGDIATQWVVNAAGLWGREVAALAGLKLPLQPTEHQYFVTETIAEIAGMERRLPSVADRDGEYYLRQEGKGLLVGAYEKDMRYWAEDGTPQGFGHELFADDLERIEPNMMRAIARVPAVGAAGIKRVINGPMIWSPDSNVLRVAIGGKGEGAVNHVLDACALQIGEAAVGKGDAVLDLVEIVLQQVLTKGPGRAIHRPGAAGLLVEPDAKAPAFLPQIAFARRVHHMGMFLAVLHHLHDQRHFLGHQVLVLHRVQREVDARHRANLARPEATCVHDVFGVDGALVGDHLPGAIGALVGFPDHAMGLDRCPAHPCGAGIGMGGAGGVEVTVERVIKPADDAVDIGDGGDLCDLLRCHDLGVQAHETVLGPFGQQHVETVLVVGKGDAADVVQPAGHAGDFFQFLVEPDGIALKCCHIGVAVQRVKPARRVPC